MENSCDTSPKSKSVKEFFASKYFWKPFLAATAGGVLGFLYYYYVGCTTGTCEITSNPYSSILMGSFLGYFVVNSPCARGNC
jgi:hypothetical protein